MAPDNYLFPVERVELIRQGYDMRFASGFQRIQLENYSGPPPKNDDSFVRLDCLCQ